MTGNELALMIATFVVVFIVLSAGGWLKRKSDDAEDEIKKHEM